MAERAIDPATGNLVCPRCSGWVVKGKRCRRCWNRKLEEEEKRERRRRLERMEAERARRSRQMQRAREVALARYVAAYLGNSRRYRKGDGKARPPHLWAQENPLNLPNGAVRWSTLVPR